jgi:hypothetical protein
MTARTCIVATLFAGLAAPTQAAPPAAVRAGAYECWANGYARMNMNFTVTGAGSYRNESGVGRLSVGPGGRLQLTGPMLESMPDGFVAVYHEPNGTPTVSFRSPRGAEAAFCERAR